MSQKITFEDYLPALVGHRLAQFVATDASASVDPQVSIEFATVGHRYYHTMSPPEYSVRAGQRVQAALWHTGLLVVGASP